MSKRSNIMKIGNTDIQNFTEYFDVIISFFYLRETDTLLRETTLSILFLLTSEKGSTLKGKNLLPAMGANSFLLEQTTYQKANSIQESKQDLTKVVSLVKIGRKSTKCINSP